MCNNSWLGLHKESSNISKTARLICYSGIFFPKSYLITILVSLPTTLSPLPSSLEELWNLNAKGEADYAARWHRAVQAIHKRS